MKKIIFIFIALGLSLILTACANQTCNIKISAIVKEKRIIGANETQILKEKNWSTILSVYPKPPKGNGGINPFLGFYFAVNPEDRNEYYLILKHLYSEDWFGPNYGSLPDCFSS